MRRLLAGAVLVVVVLSVAAANGSARDSDRDERDNDSGPGKTSKSQGRLGSEEDSRGPSTQHPKEAAAGDVAKELGGHGRRDRVDSDDGKNPRAKDSDGTRERKDSSGRGKEKAEDSDSTGKVEVPGSPAAGGGDPASGLPSGSGAAAGIRVDAEESELEPDDVTSGGPLGRAFARSDAPSGTAQPESAAEPQNAPAPAASSSACPYRDQWSCPLGENLAAPSELLAVPGFAGGWSTLVVGLAAIGGITTGIIGLRTWQAARRRPLKTPAGPEIAPEAGTNAGVPDMIERVRDQPFDPAARFDLGIQLLQQGNSERGARHLEQSFRLAPENVLRLLKDPQYQPLLSRAEVRQVLRRYQREQEHRLWYGYA